MRSAIILTIIFIFSAYTSFSQTAQFTANDTKGCDNLKVQFTDQSVGATAWQWDFGNGNKSTEQNPRATYASPGTYTVSLTVNGATTETKSGFIKVYEKPTVAFNVPKQDGCQPLTIEFTDNSTAVEGNIIEWLWDFGTGELSYEQHPVYTFQYSSKNSITLKVTDSHGCENFISKTNYISVYPAPVAKFTYAYDFTTNELKTYNSCTHEISLNININIHDKKIVSPRYFRPNLHENVTSKKQHLMKKYILYN